MRLRFFIRAVLIALVLSAAFAADKDQRLVREIAFGALVNTGIWYWLRRRGLFKASHFDLDSLVLVCFAAGATVQALGTHLETEIPRLRAVYRLIFYAYLYFMLSPAAARLSFTARALVSVLIFTSLPFQWSGIVSSARALLPAVTMLYVLWRSYETGRVVKRRILRDAGTAAAMTALVLFAAAQVYHHNYFDGIDGFARLLTGAGVFLALRMEQKRTRIFTVFASLALFNIGFLLFAYGFAALEGPNAFWTKRQSLGGINTNDIGTYVAALIPICALGAATGSKAGRRLSIAALVLLILMLGLSYARLAWPTAAAGLLAAIFWSRFRPRLKIRPAMAAATVALVIASAGLPFLIERVAFDLQSGEWASLQYRISLIRQGLGLIARYPVAGAGPGGLGALASFSQADSTGFARFVEESGGLVHVHNLFLQTWIEGGIAGALSIALIAGIALMRIQTTRARATGAGALLLLAVLAHGQLNHPFEVTQVWLLFCLAAALVVPRIRFPFLRWPAALLFALSVLLVAAQTLAAGLHASTLKSLQGMKYRNVLGALEIRPAAPMNPDSGSLGLLLQLYPGDRRLTQEAAEIYRAYAVQKQEAPAKAAELFAVCAHSHIAPAFCLWRLSEITASGGDRSRAELIERQAEEKDPFRLGKSKILHPL